MSRPTVGCKSMLRNEIAEKKRQRVDKLLDDKVPPAEIRKRIMEEFGTGVANTYLYQRFHEKNGTRPTRNQRRKKPKPKPKAKKKSTDLAVVHRPTEPIDVTVTAHPSQAVDVLLSSLLRAMRAEGVDSVMIRADGRATVYHVVSREVQIR